MEWHVVLLAIGIGLLTGFINTLAGSGSLITLPFLIFAGLPADVANATNRVGVFLQTLVGTVTIQSQNRIPLRGAGIMVWPSVAGSVVGALLALSMDAKTMHWVIGILMILLLVPVTINPKKWLRKSDEAPTHSNPWLTGTIFFILGIYGGFIQAGVGIFLLSAMVLIANFSITRANMLKGLITCVFTIPALAIFIWNGKVEWGIGLILAAGQMVGAWFAARFLAQHELAGQITRGLVVLMLVASAISMFFK